MQTGAFARKIIFNNKANYQHYRIIRSWNAFSMRHFALFRKMSSTGQITLTKNSLLNSNFRLFCSQTVSHQANGDSYIASRYHSLSENANLEPYESFHQSELEEYIQSHLMQSFGFSEEDIDYLMHYNNNVCLPSTHEKGGIVGNCIEYFSTNFGVSPAEMKEIILRYPILLRYQDLFIDDRIKLYKDLGINDEELTHEDICDIFK